MEPKSLQMEKRDSKTITAGRNDFADRRSIRERNKINTFLGTGQQRVVSRKIYTARR